jgi:hypothetical protein
MRALGLLLVCSCAVDRAAMTPDAPPAQVAQPSGCAETFTLVGAVTPSPHTLGPITIDGAGVNLCMRLDSSQLSRAHFMGGTAYEDGTASSFVATLERASDRTTIQDGWDVTVDGTPPRTMVNLEWSPAGGSIVDTILWVRARNAPTTTTIDAALFDPLE